MNNRRGRAAVKDKFKAWERETRDFVRRRYVPELHEIKPGNPPELLMVLRRIDKGEDQEQL